MRTCGLIAATTLVGVAIADVEIGGNYTFQRDAQVTMRLLIGGQLMSESTATVQMSGSARSIVTLSDMPSVPADLFTTQIVTGRVEAFEMTATDAPLSMMGITINLRNMRGRFGDCFGMPGTIDVFNNGPGGAFLDQFDGAIEIEGDLEMSGGVAPLAFATTVQLADGGPQAATILSEYDLSFQNNQLVQTIGIFDGGGVLAGGFVSDGVEVQLAFSIQTEIVGNSLVTPTQIQCCTDDVAAGTLFDAGQVAKFVTSTNPNAIAVADLNGDGRQDMAVATDTNDVVSVLIGNGSNQFAAAVNYATGDFPSDVEAGDVDGDGHVDLVVVNNFSDDVSVLLNNGDGTFAAPQHFAVGDVPIRAALGDLDADGDLDIAVVGSRFTAPNTFVLFNDGNGAFTLAPTMQSANPPSDVELADIDGDNDLDMVLPLGGADFVAFRRNDSTGVFGNALGFNIGPTGDGPRSIAVGDIDGDGDLDCVTANSNSNNVTGILNTNGTFTSALRGNFALNSVSSPNGIRLSDLDDDGDLDAIVSYREDLEGGGVNTLINDGTGVFASPIDHVVPGICTGMNIGDFDQDGDSDVALSMLESGSVLDFVKVLTNGCTGSIAPPPCPGDVDGDRDIDLTDLSTLLSNFGAASGQTRTQGDLDGDGDVDLSDLAQLLANFGGSCP